MPREPRRKPYTWVTWLSPLIAGDASCWWAGWFRSHFKYEKLERDDFDLDAWKVQHTQMVSARAAQLQADGWTVTLEDQNFFTLRGRVGTLSGKPDIVAVKGLEVLVVDCKGGKRRTSDRVQVAEYLFALPFASPDRFASKRLSGEVQYQDGSIEIPAEQFTDELRQAIVAGMHVVSAPAEPPPVPSARECAHCDISAKDCAARLADVEPAVANVTVF